MIVLLSISITCVLLSFTVQNSLQTYFTFSKKAMINYRAIYTSLNNETIEQTITNLEKLDHVVKVIPASQFHVGVKINNFTDKYDGNISLYGRTSQLVPNILKGDNFDSYFPTDNVLICPINMIPNTFNSGYDKLDPVDMTNWLNKTVQLKLGHHIEDYKIIGLYDDKWEGKYQCYTTFENIAKWQQTENIQDTMAIVFLDSYEAVEPTLNQLKSNGYYNSFPVAQHSYALIDPLLKELTKISSFCFIIAILVFLFEKYQDQKQNCSNKAILKSLGYQKKQYFMILFEESLFLFLLSFIVTICFYYLALNLGTMFLKGTVLIDTLILTIPWKEFVIVFVIYFIFLQLFHFLLALLFEKTKLIKQLEEME